jgi:GDP-mannose transporter
MSMTLTNKAVLSSFNFGYPFTLLLWQNLFSVSFVVVGQWLGVLKAESLEMGKVKRWIPVNLLFIAMLVTHSLSLSRLSVPMVTVFKNLSTIAVAIGDSIMLGQEVTPLMYLSSLLMVVGSVVAGWTDLEFDFLGYQWMVLNAIMSAAYLLYLKYLTKTMPMSEFGMVRYNNALSIPIALAWCFYYEAPVLMVKEIDVSNSFAAIFIYAGLNGLLVSLTSLWCVKKTSPTTYSMVGAINKIPLTLIATVLFRTKLSDLGKVSIVVALVGGILYTWAKSLQRKEQHQIQKEDKEEKEPLKQSHDGREEMITTNTPQVTIVK